MWGPTEAYRPEVLRGMELNPGEATTYSYMQEVNDLLAVTTSDSPSSQRNLMLLSLVILDQIASKSPR